MLKIQWFILRNSALLIHQTDDGEEEETITGTIASGLLQHAKVPSGQRASTKSKPIRVCYRRNKQAALGRQANPRLSEGVFEMD